MGWNKKIKLNKIIDEKDLNNILLSMPKRFHGFGKQHWGWSMLVDVLKPEKNEKFIKISGAGFSLQYADTFETELIKNLKVKKYK